MAAERRRVYWLTRLVGALPSQKNRAPDCIRRLVVKAEVEILCAAYCELIVLVLPGSITSIFAPCFSSSADGTLMIWPLTTGVFAVMPGGCEAEARGVIWGRTGAPGVIDFNSRSKINTAFGPIFGGKPRGP